MSETGINEILSRIGFCHRMFLVCLSVAVFLLAAAVVLSVRWNIWELWEYLSGRRVRKELHRLERENEPERASGFFPEEEKRGGEYEGEDKTACLCAEADETDNGKRQDTGFSSAASGGTGSETAEGFRTVFLGK